MGKYRPLDTKCWITFLEHHGFFPTGKSVGSHFKYTKPGARMSIPVWQNKKEIPAAHLKTGCTTIGCTLDELYEWVSKNC